VSKSSSVANSGRESSGSVRPSGSGRGPIAQGVDEVLRGAQERDRFLERGSGPGAATEQRTEIVERRLRVHEKGRTGLEGRTVSGHGRGGIEREAHRHVREREWSPDSHADPVEHPHLDAEPESADLRPHRREVEPAEGEVVLGHGFEAERLRIVVEFLDESEGRGKHAASERTVEVRGERLALPVDDRRARVEGELFAPVQQRRRDREPQLPLPRQPRVGELPGQMHGSHGRGDEGEKDWEGASDRR